MWGLTDLSIQVTNLTHFQPIIMNIIVNRSNLQVRRKLHAQIFL
jgi:hypothetical protein